MNCSWMRLLHLFWDIRGNLLNNRHVFTFTWRLNQLSWWDVWKKVQDVMKQPFCLNVYGCSGASKCMHLVVFHWRQYFDQFVQLFKEKNTVNLELLKKANKKSNQKQFVIRIFPQIVETYIKVTVIILHLRSSLHLKLSHLILLLFHAAF